jgi:hypothetical protein
MTLQGTIRDGLVVLDENVQIPDGTKVAVYVPAPATAGVESGGNARHDWVPADDPELRRKALAELLAIPDENPSDDFRAEDADQVLYGGQE